MLETFNWLALTVPFIGAAAAFQSLRERGTLKVIAGIVACLIVTFSLFGYSLLYRSFGFPLWMRWLQPFFETSVAKPLSNLEVTVGQQPVKPDVISYFNTQLREAKPYQSYQLKLDKCSADSCTYMLQPGIGLVEIVSRNNSTELVRIVAPIGSGDGFSEEMKALTFLFSLFIWGQMPTDSSYDDANKLLSSLTDKMDVSVPPGAAVVSLQTWTLGAVATKCFGNSIMYVGVLTGSRAVFDLSNHPEACQK